MKNLATFSAILLLTASSFFTSCQKAEELVTTKPPVDVFEPTLPDARLNWGISFAHSTYTGECLPTFRNCIVIWWNMRTAMEGNRPYISTENGAALDEYYGSYFPLTNDYVMNADPQPGTSGGPVTIKAGIYPVSQTADGRIVFLDQVSPNGQTFNVAPLTNIANPQDGIGNIHNLAMQAILTTDNIKEMAKLANNEAELRSYVARKTEAFLAENGIDLQTGEADRIAKTPIADNYENHAAVIAKSTLSAADQLILTKIIDEAAAMPVTNLKELDAFVKFMTERENELANSGSLDNAKACFSDLSIMKYSRYYWFWHELSKGNPAAAGKKPWWKADIEGLLTGGLGQAITDSIVAYFTK